MLISVQPLKETSMHPIRFKMTGESLFLTEAVSHLSTSTSRVVFPQQLLCERDPVFSVSSGKDPKRPCLKRRPDFPEVA